MKEDWVVQRSAELRQQDVADELVALDVQGGACYWLNSTARQVWLLIEKPKTVGDIRDALVAEFDIDPQTCELEVMELLRELEAAKLATLSPASTRLGV